MDRSHIGAFILGAGIGAAALGFGLPDWGAVGDTPGPALAPTGMPRIPSDETSAEVTALRERVNFLTMKLAFLASLMAEQDRVLSDERPRANAGLPARRPSPPEPPVLSTQRLIEDTQEEDLALQRRALDEGWAMGRELMERRMRLWQDAREQMPERDYLKGLHKAGLINQLYVLSTRQGGREAGVQVEDVLVSVDGERIINRWELKQLLQHQGEGGANTLVLRRGSQRITAVVTDPLRSLEWSGRSVDPDA